MPEQKTKPGTINAADFLNDLPDEKKRRDAQIILAIMREVTGFEPKIWGGSMIGFGCYHYKYASGHEGEYFLIGFAPGKTKFSIYLMCGAEAHPAVLSRLGKYKTGKSCLYINKLSDVDVEVLRELIKVSFEAGPKVC